MPQLGQAIGSRPHRHGIRLLSETASIGGDPRRAARAIDALRRGWPIEIRGTDASLFLAAIETGFDMAAATGLLISASRAATLKLANQRAAADTALPVLIKAPSELDAALAIANADPA